MRVFAIPVSLLVFLGVSAFHLPLHAQQHIDLGGYVSRTGIGLHGAWGHDRVSAYGRAEMGLQAAGVAIAVAAPAEGTLVASVLGGRGSCSAVLLGERGTGCDEQWHGFWGGTLGAHLRASRRGSLFLEAQRLQTWDGSTDVPRWSIAVGFMLRVKGAK